MDAMLISYDCYYSLIKADVALFANVLYFHYTFPGLQVFMSAGGSQI